MAQYFYINSNSVNPTLRMELVDDGKYDFYNSHVFNTMIESSNVTFSMWDEHDILKISKAQCNVFVNENSNCTRRYIIEYKWRKRDTNKKGTFTGKFEFNFGEVKENGIEFPKGNMILPIQEELIIVVK